MTQPTASKKVACESAALAGSSRPVNCTRPGLMASCSCEFTLASDRLCLVVTEGRHRFSTDRAGPS